MEQPTDKSCVLLCARCGEDVGIKLEELETAVMLPKPLSDSEIQQISHRYHYTYNPDYIGFARAIEKEHGIK